MICINLLNERYKNPRSPKSWIWEIGVIVLIWFSSLLISNSVFDRPLDIDAHHEYLMAHSLVSLRALDQWGIGNLLGASVLVPKSSEYLHANITIFNKADGVYLSYPSLWLVVPYLIFKTLTIPISNANLQIYHLICDRLLSSIVIYFLFLEIIQLFEKINFVKGWGRKILALLATSAWMFNPPVLYWSQNVYFCDQAVLLPIYGLLLFAIKERFQFHNLSRSKRLILFSLSLLAAGFDWYGWVFLFLLILVVTIHLAPKTIWAALQPVITAITIIIIWFGSQLFYFKDGFNQITNVALERVGAHLKFELNQEVFVMSLYWVQYLPKFLQSIWDAGKLSLPIIFLGLVILLGWLYWHTQNKSSLLSVALLIIFSPLLQIVLLRQHSTIHDFSAFKFALPTIFTIWIIIPLSILILLDYLPNLLQSFVSLFGQELNPLYALIFQQTISWLMVGVFIFLVVFINQDVSSEFTKFAGSGKRYPKEIGAIIQKYISTDDLPISNSMSLGSVPPQLTWYTNRFIYRTPELRNLPKRLNVPNLKHLNPVFLIYENEIPSQLIQNFCWGLWQSIPERVMGRRVFLCRSEKLRELL